mmetsp:Transcript_28631/g.80642  ORF Transcript_28631/g.80642 Transcript_28631/m.80642 type:complete len:89 (-) Transcript_28631:93-359(-)
MGRQERLGASRAELLSSGGLLDVMSFLHYVTIVSVLHHHQHASFRSSAQQLISPAGVEPLTTVNACLHSVPIHINAHNIWYSLPPGCQ